MNLHHLGSSRIDVVRFGLFCVSNLNLKFAEKDESRNQKLGINTKMVYL